ncbi:MAG: phosphoglycerate kinase, partial [Chloroflexi bacterium]|nr:phosphoglycerate kinase [Chloroflexota bacterium]
MRKKTVRDIDVSGKRVLMRVDYNVPMDVASGRILDDKRIRATLPTLDYLRLEGARVVLLSHLGRPKGKRDPSLSLAPVAARLAELMGEPVQTADDCIGTVVQDAVAALTDGDVLLLENVRFHPEEEANEEEFAKALASLGDVFVNDAFGVAHRASASTEGVAHLRPAVAGFLMESEINFLSRAVEEPERPYAAIIGGAKVSSKMAVIEALLERVDKLMLGGGMANTFLKAEGFDVAESLVEDDYMAEAKRIEAKASELDGVAQDPGRRRLDELAGVQARRLAQRLGQRPRVAADQ